MNIGDIVTVRDYQSQYIICKVHTDVWSRYDIIDLETGYLHVVLAVVNWRWYEHWRPCKTRSLRWLRIDRGHTNETLEHHDGIYRMVRY